MFTNLSKALIASAIFLVAGGLFLQNRAKVYANVAEPSATLANPLGVEEKEDKRVGQLRLFLNSYNSPLEDYSDEFVKAADKYNLDWKLVPAITGVESTFGKQIPQGSYNAYGWANGNYYFQSWPESIEIVTKTLKENYIDRGASTVERIAPIYAPPSKTWAGKVRYFMDRIENFGLLTNETAALALSL